MKRSQVRIPWSGGLHLRPAAKLVKQAKSFQSSISLKVGQKAADARSILAISLLCGTLGTVLELEVSGADEAPALAAIESLFELEESDGPSDGDVASQAEKPIG
jgi:phosphotransferase system HPr (HPr) family protein